MTRLLNAIKKSGIVMLGLASLNISGMELSFNVTEVPFNVKPYGKDVKISVTDLGDHHALLAEFDDKSNVAWCNKGFTIQLPQPIDWNSFDFVRVDYPTPVNIKMVSISLIDEDNNLWYSFNKSGLGKGFHNFDKDTIRYSYNMKDKNAPRLSKKHGKIKTINISVGTANVNSDHNYSFILGKINFSKRQNEVAMEVQPDSNNTVAFGTYGDIRKPISETIELAIDRGNIGLKFDDRSPTWFHKGARIKLDKPIDWKDFVGISYNCTISHPVTMVAICMLDEHGVWWECFSQKNKVNEPNTIIFEKETFRRSELTYKYDDRRHERKGKIVELYPFFGVAKSNLGINYTGNINNIVFIKKFASGHYQYDVVEDFPMQWKCSGMMPDGTMLVDGKPFFPLMLYSCLGLDVSSGTGWLSLYTGKTDDETNLNRLQEIKKAGFNTIMSYTLNLYGQKVSGPGWDRKERSRFPGYAGETTEALFHEGAQKFLDYCQKLGLKGMIGAYSTYTLPLPLPPENRKQMWDHHKARISSIITKFKDHPALLMWYMSDEPSSMNTPPNDLLQAYQFAKNLDQSRPFYMAAADPLNDQEYFKATDIVAPDSYPLAFNKPISNDSINQPLYAKAQKNGWPVVWRIIQMCQWKPELENRLPTEAQIRTQCFLGLADNLKGLAFYEHKNYPEKRPKQWEKISNVVNSLHSILPDILASEKVITSGLSVNQDIRYIMHKVKDKNYYLLLAVNGKENYTDEIPRKKPIPVALGQVGFSLGSIKIAKIEALDENEKGKLKLGKIRSVPINEAGNGFSDDFGIYAAHAYRIFLNK